MEPIRNKDSQPGRLVTTATEGQTTPESPPAVPVTPEPPTVETADPVDEHDVPAALQRTTTDGPGDEDPGPSDFDSFADPTAEQETPDEETKPGRQKTVVQRPENVYTYPYGQGNTDPSVFDGFDASGNFVELRHR